MQARQIQVEHYGILIAESTIRNTTLHHAQKIQQRSHGAPQGLPEKVASGQTFIAEIDGSMVPTVRSDAAQKDRRKGKSVQWQEAKLSLAHAKDSKAMSYAATLLGDVDTAGKQLRACAKRAGLGAGHKVHAVGDGAPWIVAQVKQRFGAQGSYLLDFYHMCDYLSAAADAIHSQSTEKKAWMEQQKHRLKTQGLGANRRGPSAGAQVLSLPESTPRPTALRHGNQSGLAYRLRRDRARAPVHP